MRNNLIGIFLMSLLLAKGIYAEENQKVENTSNNQIEEKINTIENQPSSETQQTSIEAEEQKPNLNEKAPISDEIQKIEQTPVVQVETEKIPEIQNTVEEKVDVDQKPITEENPSINSSEKIQINENEVEKAVENTKEEIIVPTTTTNSENNDVKISEEVVNEKNGERNWQTLIMFVVSLVFIFGLLTLVFLSIYYRIYVFRKRTAPFEVPEFLSTLFPKPINYEHEITILCSKYMNN
jgi:hypothetical protein